MGGHIERIRALEERVEALEKENKVTSITGTSSEPKDTARIEARIEVLEAQVYQITDNVTPIVAERRAKLSRDKGGRMDP